MTTFHLRDIICDENFLFCVKLHLFNDHVISKSSKFFYVSENLQKFKKLFFLIKLNFFDFILRTSKIRQKTKNPYFILLVNS